MQRTAKLAAESHAENRVNVRFSETRMKQILASAKEMDLTAPNFIRVAVDHFLEHRG